MKDNNNEHNKPRDGGEDLGENTPESLRMKQFQKERKEAIDAAKNLESELAHKLEDHEGDRETQEAEELMRKTDFPELRPEGHESPEYAELKKMFEEIPTDYIQYNFLRRIFPSLVQRLEKSRLGNNIGVDVVGIPIGGVDSLASATKLAGHMLVDLGELLIQPKIAYERTKSMIS